VSKSAKPSTTERAGRKPGRAGGSVVAPIPFCIVGLGRSGTTLLRYLLDSHPDIRCMGEALGQRNDWKRSHAGLSLEEYIHTIALTYPFTASGYKLRFQQIGTYPEIIGLMEELDFRWVVIERVNHLDHYLSTRLASASGIRHSRQVYPETRLTVDCDALLAHARDLVERSDEVRHLASRFLAIFTTYEQVRDGHGLDEIQRFLGVEPVPLSTITVRSRQQTREEVIANFDEVVDALRGTPWENDPFAAE
jgi:hypothetical protein